MSDIFVPPNDREVFEAQFIDLHSALGLKATSNSGAYWGDGDARPQAKLEEKLTFAVEMKTRKSNRLTPKPAEFVKAFGEAATLGTGQLGKFDSQAIRLMAVYSLEEETYAVSIPETDWMHLCGTLRADKENATEKYVQRRSGPNLKYRMFKWMQWKDLYQQIETHD